MSRTPAVLLLIAALLAACYPKSPKAPAAPRKAAAPTGQLDKARLETGIDQKFGGVGTCVIIADTSSGDEVYRYNSNAVCMNPLPPCATFQVPLTLMGLDAGAVTPATVLKWDKSPQPVRAWQHDADLKAAFSEGIHWWFAALARKLGPERLKQGLDAYDYGAEHKVDGPVTSFWMGPAEGGRLGVSTRQQVQFLHHLYAGKLPAKPEAAGVLKDLMVDEIRQGYTMSGKAGSCPTLSDGSRQVAWWVGRLTGPAGDRVFAASIEGQSDNALPGLEVQERVKSVFADAGLWPGL